MNFPLDGYFLVKLSWKQTIIEWGSIFIRAQIKVVVRDGENGRIRFHLRSKVMRDADSVRFH